MGDKLYASAKKAPDYVLHRHLEETTDTLPETVKTHGINMMDWPVAHVQVVPSSGANPVVSILFWSEKAAKYVVQHASLNYAAKGNGVAWETTVPVAGRRMFVAVTGGVGAGEECRVYVAGDRS